MTAEFRGGFRVAIKEFIEIYKSEPCLWQIKSKDYHDRSMKDAAYLKLIEKLKEIDPAADREGVVKKINNIRSNYRKEVKKVQIRSGWGKIYKPKLWYFNLLRFLNEQEEEAPLESVPNFTSPNIKCEDVSESEGYYSVLSPSAKFMPYEALPPVPPEVEDDNSSEADPPVSPIQRPPQNNHTRSKKRYLESTDSGFTNEVSLEGHFRLPLGRDDRFDIFGKNVAVKLRDLSKHQRILAEKIINDALYEAEMDNLTTSHRLTSQALDSPTSNGDSNEFT